MRVRVSFPRSSEQLAWLAGEFGTLQTKFLPRFSQSFELRTLEPHLDLKAMVAYRRAFENKKIVLQQPLNRNVFASFLTYSKL